MKKKAKSIFALMLLAVLANGFAGKADTISAKQYGQSLKAPEVAVAVLEEEEGDDEEEPDDGKTGNFLKDLKNSIEEMNKKNAETKLVTGNMELTMQCGFENMVKYGRNICIQSEITNNDSDFVGYMQVIIPSTDNENNVMYQKEISIPAGETKKIMFPLAPDAVGYRYNVRIVDEKGKEVLTKELVPNFQYDSEKLFVGVLTDEKDYLGYLSQTDIKVFYLDKDKLPDEETSLDTLDIIVFNNFNTGNLSEEQYTALKTWVSNGGCLVIGTGTTGSKTLDIFKDDFITGKFGDVNTEGVMSLELDKSQEIVSKKSDRTFYNIEKGLGNVIICSEDLGVKYADWQTVGKNIVKTIKKNLSEYKKTQIDTSADSSYYEIIDGLSNMNSIKLPSIGKYALILTIYIIITGPFLYLVLKKIDKRNLLWGLVPVSAIAFGIGIYALGSETRLNDPIVGYMNFYTLDGSGKDQGEEKIFFGITVPSNDKYVFELPETSKISCLNAGYEDYYYGGQPNNNKKNKWDYKTAISYGAEDTTVQLKNYSTFDNAYFKSQSVHTGNGTYEYHVKSYEYKLSGTFTNHLGYDLEKALVLCDQRLYAIGDIKDGESVDLGKIKEEDIYNIYSADSFYDDKMMEKLTGGDPYSNRNVEQSVRKRYGALQYMFNYQSGELLAKPKLIAFTEEESGEGFVQQLDLESNGLKVVELALDIDRTNKNNEFIPNIDEYCNVLEGEFDEQYRYSYTEEALFEVKFDEDDVIKAIEYNKEVNPELKPGGNYYGKFAGKIYFYNNDKGDYDLVIEAGTEQKITNLKPYLDDENKMLIKYKFKEGGGDETFPILSAVKEAK